MMNQIGIVTATPTALPTLIASLGSTVTTIWVTMAQTVALNLAIPPTLTLAFVPPGKLVPANGVTISYNGHIIAGQFQIFDVTTGTGTVSFAANTVMNKLNGEWWGVPQSGDAQPVLQKMVDGLRNHSTVEFNSVQTWTFNSSLLIQERISLIIESLPLSEEIAVSSIVWNGAADGKVVNMRACGHCRFSGFQIFCGAAQIGVNIEGFPGQARISTDNAVTYCRVTNNNSKANFVGVAISLNGFTNNEFMTITHNYVDGGGDRSAGLGTGIYVGADSNNHGHILHYNTCSGCEFGVNGLWSGYHMFRGNFNQNETDVRIEHMSYPTVMEFCDSETSAQHLVQTAGGESSLWMQSGRVASAGYGAVPWIQFTNDPNAAATLAAYDFQNYDGNGSSILQVPTLGTGRIATLPNQFNVISGGMPLNKLLVYVNEGGSADQLKPITLVNDFLATDNGPVEQIGADLTVTTGEINVTGAIHKVAGPDTIDTITLVPALLSCATGRQERTITIWLLANGGDLTLNAGGNIAVGSTIPDQTVMAIFYNPTDALWYPAAV